MDGDATGLRLTPLTVPAPRVAADYQLIGTIIAAVAAVGSSASALAAWRTGIKTSRTTEAASEALAMVLRPTFALHVLQQEAAEDGLLPITLISTSPYTALNVSVDIRGPQHERLASREFPRVPGKPNDVLADESKAPTLHVALPPLVEGDERRLSVLLRFRDERGLERWEQFIGFTVLSESRGGVLLRRAIDLDLGEPRKTPTGQ